MKNVVIIGGGIAGLTTAYRLEQWGRGRVNYKVIESLPCVGGKITSAYQDGFLIEGGPDSFSAEKPAAIELCRSLGLEDQLIGLKSTSRRALLWSNGKLRPMPEGLSLVPARITPFLKSSLISWPGKLRMGVELFIPPNRDDASDESLAAFVRRRLGHEALRTIADPLMAGIHAGDPERLSLKSTFPRLRELEMKHGSLLGAMWAQRNAKQTRVAARGSYSPLVTLRGGLRQLIAALTVQLDPKAISVNRRIRAIVRSDHDYEIFFEGESIRADAIVFSTPAHVTADLVAGIAPGLASKLREIHYVSTATVSLGFHRHDVPALGDGTGYVVANNEQRRILGCTWCSNKFEGRAPEGHVLVRVFIGGARAEHLAEQDDDRLLELAREELRATMGIDAAPVLAKVYRWQKANPQYEIGHQARIAEIDRLISEQHGLYLSGAGYRGVGIPDCIQSGNRAAQTLLEDTIEQSIFEASYCDLPLRSSYEYQQ